MENLSIDFSNVKPSTSQPQTFETDETDSNPSSRFGVRRSSRTRSNSEDNLHKINRRTIARPKKVISVDSSPKDIKNFYLNANKKKFKPTLLETIQEEECEDKFNETTTEEEDLSFNSFLIKKCKKFKRSLSLCDGLTINKALQAKRKNRVKKVFGKRARIKKMKMAFFMSHMKSIEEDTTEGAVPIDNVADVSSISSTSQNENETSVCAEMEDDV